MKIGIFVHVTGAVLFMWLVPFGIVWIEGILNNTYGRIEKLAMS